MTNNFIDIKGFEGLYKVNILGEILSLRDNHGTYREKKLKSTIRANWYPTVNLLKDKIRYQFTIHRILAENFIENPYNKPEVNHKDWIKTNNSIENLKWVTTSENRKHAYAMNLEVSGMRKRILDWKTWQIFDSIIQAATHYGIDRSTVRNIANWKQLSLKYKFVYYVKESFS